MFKNQGISRKLFPVSSNESHYKKRKRLLDVPNNLKVSDILKAESAPPLLRMSRSNDEIYQRLPRVEQQIATVLRLDLIELAEQFKINARDDERFVAEETLTCLLRAALRVGELNFADELTTALYRRAAKSVRQRCSKVFATASAAQDCAADALSDLFGELCAHDQSRADFAEVRFGLFLKRIINRNIAKYQKRQFAEADFEFLDDTPEAGKPPPELAAQAALSSFEFYDLKKALDLLPEPVRTAFVLRHKYGLQIESANASEMTIAKYFDKTEKTIRNWLWRADKILQKLRV